MSSLRGVRVLDLSAGLAGGLAGRFLAEAGAEVVKVETDRSRLFAGFAPVTMRICNRSKQRVDLDLDSPADQGELARCAATVDVILHEAADAEFAAFGLGEVLARRPEIIIGACPPVPPDYADQDLAGHELLVQAWLGLSTDQRSVSGKPMFIRMPVCGISAAYLLASGIVSRLIDRQRTGRGGRVGTSLLQGGLMATALYWQKPGSVPPGMNMIGLQRDRPQTDLTIFAGRDGRWLQVLGGWSESAPVLEALAERDLVYLAGQEVTEQSHALWKTVFAAHDREEWLARLWQADVPCMPVLERGEILQQEQSLLNSFSVRVDDPLLGATQQNGAPFSIWREGELETGHPLPPRAETDPGQPLAGLRVVDFGRHVSGPFAAQCLADLGAEVIRVETFNADRQILQSAGCQRGKLSMRINLRQPGALPVIRRLVEWSDVVMHNYRYTAALATGFGGVTLHEYNPNAVVSAVTGYGTVGPWTGLPAYDAVGQALSGWERGIVTPDDDPCYQRSSIMDTWAGAALCLGTLVALYARGEQGGSHSVSSALMGVAAVSDCGSYIGSLGDLVAELPILAQQAGVSWNYRIYHAKDESIAVVALTAEEQASFLCALGVRSPGQLEEAIAERAVTEVHEQLRERGVLCEVVRTNAMEGFFASAAARGSDLVVRYESSRYGAVEQTGSYWNFPESRLVTKPIAEAGEHTVEVLRTIGFSDGEIEQLYGADMVRDRDSAMRVS
jgi:crotonobetainyl-CoA:carnitine CoA-transferase CaiB-like acyl-CoA transferase